MSILHDPSTPWYEDARETIDTENFCAEDGVNGHWVEAILRAALAEREAFETRRDELLALVAKLSRETPYDDENTALRSQMRALIVEVGTLRSRIVELQTFADKCIEESEGKL